MIQLIAVGNIIIVMFPQNGRSNEKPHVGITLSKFIGDNSKLIKVSLIFDRCKIISEVSLPEEHEAPDLIREYKRYKSYIKGLIYKYNDSLVGHYFSQNKSRITILDKDTMEMYIRLYEASDLCNNGKARSLDFSTMDKKVLRKSYLRYEVYYDQLSEREIDQSKKVIGLIDESEFDRFHGSLPDTSNLHMVSHTLDKDEPIIYLELSDGTTEVFDAREYVKDFPEADNILNMEYFHNVEYLGMYDISWDTLCVHVMEYIQSKRLDELLKNAQSY